MKIVFDIDGTLADLSHRLHYIQPAEGEEKDWDGFFAACMDDAPIPHVIQTLKDLSEMGHPVEFWTGRSEAVREETIQWLMKHLRWPSFAIKLKMRPIGDHRPDYLLKSDYIDFDDKPDLIFEDRKTVVEMFRRNGIQVFQVAPGDF